MCRLPNFVTRRLPRYRYAALVGSVWVAMVCCALPASASGGLVSAEVQIVNRAADAHSHESSRKDASNVALWLIPLDTQTQAAAATEPQKPAPQLVQRNKTFQPHVVVVEVGTAVEFPNKDPFFHNIFSLFDGKRFDLGLYESGSTRTVRFDRPGVAFFFATSTPK